MVKNGHTVNEQMMEGLQQKTAAFNVSSPLPQVYPISSPPSPPHSTDSLHAAAPGPPVDLKHRGTLQFRGDDAETKRLMNRVASGEATEAEVAMFNAKMNKFHSMPQALMNRIATGEATEAELAKFNADLNKKPSKSKTQGPLLPPGAPMGSISTHLSTGTLPQHTSMEPGALRGAMDHAGPNSLATPSQRVQQAPEMQLNSWEQELRDRYYTIGPENMEEMNRSEGLNAEPPVPRQSTLIAAPNHALQDYQMQIKLLDQQNKKRLPVVRQKQDTENMNGNIGLSAESTVSSHLPQDPQMRLMLLEAQNKKRLLMAKREQDTENTNGKIGLGAESTVSSRAIQDHAFQLMLLEQQNKKRLLMARQEQDIKNMNGKTGLGAEPTVPSHPMSSMAQQDYQMQLMLLEQQNRKRLLMARQEQNPVDVNGEERASTGPREPPFDPSLMAAQQFEFQRWTLDQQDKRGFAMARQEAAMNEADEGHQPFTRATRENAEKYCKPFCDFITENPTVFHCVAAMKKELKHDGFVELDERDAWHLKSGGGYFVERNGSSLIAFVVGKNYEPGNGAAILAGHVDALTAKLKPVSRVPNKAGYLQLGVAPYAGSFSGNTWWDRDLGIGGRVIVKEGDKTVTKLVKLDWPIARIPTLAPHFGAVAKGPFNPETQMVPIIGLDSSSSDNEAADPFGRPSLLHGGDGEVNSFVKTQPPALVKAIGDALGLANAHSEIVNWELELFDIQPATVGGLNKELIFAGRIDDKLCSWAALQALKKSKVSDDGKSSIIKTVGLFDNEEIGSLLRQGARSNFLSVTLERTVGCLANHNLTSDLMGRTFANSFLVSSDVVHAVNPNFLGAYLENHTPHLNVGIVVSTDVNGRMTTDAVSTSILQRCADKVDAKLQLFQIRNDGTSGGTVGPMLSSATGIRAIDAGIPQLSMHSIRATTGNLDPGLGVLMFAGFLDGFESVDKELRSVRAVR